MIYVLKMPTRSLLVCQSEATIKSIREEYGEIFIPIVAKISNAVAEQFNHLFEGDKIGCHKFKNTGDLRLFQYQPSPGITLFINNNHDESKFFSNLHQIVDYKEVRLSCPPGHLIKVDVHIPEPTEQALMIEGVYEGISGTEIIRMVLDLFIAVRKEVHAGRDAAKQVELAIKYMLMK